MAVRIVESVFTLYMLLILVRWLSPYIELDLYDIRYRWICRLVDPVVSSVRRILPSLGPMDFGPLATLLLVWVARELAMTMVAGSGLRPIG